jgi:riboflavin kinase/FMN adenylyltransferase
MSSLERLERHGAVVVIGNFDGVHRGHQAVLAQGSAIADERGLRCVPLTFYPHPAVVLGRTPPPPLLTIARRAELLARHGGRSAHFEPFTRELAAWSPERFARELLVARLEAASVVVGENFRFGKDRAGSIETLRVLGGALGFDTVASRIVGDDKGTFSSTRIRDAHRAGDVVGAAGVLGRWHGLSGVVERGDQLGRTLGFPTANLGGVEEMQPPHGVYAVAVDLLGDSGDRALAKGVMNVGVRPTVSGTAALRLEVHLFDFDGDVYGARLRANLVARLREERKFPGIDALKAQIAADARAAREALAAVAPCGASYG